MENEVTTRKCDLVFNLMIASLFMVSVYNLELASTFSTHTGRWSENILGVVLIKGNLDEISFSIMHNWFNIRVDTADFAQNGRLSRICSSDNQDAELCALLPDLIGFKDNPAIGSRGAVVMSHSGHR